MFRAVKCCAAWQSCKRTGKHSGSLLLDWEAWGGELGVAHSLALLYGKEQGAGGVQLVQVLGCSLLSWQCCCADPACLNDLLKQGEMPWLKPSSSLFLLLFPIARSQLITVRSELALSSWTLPVRCYRAPWCAWTLTLQQEMWISLICTSSKLEVLLRINYKAVFF